VTFAGFGFARAPLPRAPPASGLRQRAQQLEMGESQHTAHGIASLRPNAHGEAAQSPRPTESQQLTPVQLLEPVAAQPTASGAGETRLGAHGEAVQGQSPVRATDVAPPFESQQPAAAQRRGTNSGEPATDATADARPGARGDTSGCSHVRVTKAALPADSPAMSLTSDRTQHTLEAVRPQAAHECAATAAVTEHDARPLSAAAAAQLTGSPPLPQPASPVVAPAETISVPCTAPAAVAAARGTRAAGQPAASPASKMTLVPQVLDAEAPPRQTHTLPPPPEPASFAVPSTAQTTLSGPAAAPVAAVRGTDAAEEQAAGTAPEAEVLMLRAEVREKDEQLRACRAEIAEKEDAFWVQRRQLEVRCGLGSTVGASLGTPARLLSILLVC